MPTQPPRSPRTALHAFIRASRVRLFVLLTTAVLLLVVGLSAWIGIPGKKTYRVRVTGGHPSLNRHKVAEYMKRHSSEAGLTVEIVPTEGTPEAVRRVQSGELDLALVNGLLRFPDADRVRQVATLTVEPCHLLVKRETAKRVEEDASQLNGMSLDVGPENGETTILAIAVLKFLGLKPASDSNVGVRLSRLGIDDLLARVKLIETAPPEQVAALRSSLPDAVFHSSTLPSPLAEGLIKFGGYRLVPLRFSRGFAQVSVEEEDLDRDHIDQIHTEPATIPAYTYGGVPPVPPADLQTLGCPLVLIANVNVPDEVVAGLLPRIYEGPIARLYHPPELSTVAPTYPLHRASVAYKDRNRPLVRADVADLIQKVLGGIAPLVGGCLALYGYYRWRQVLKFLHFYRRLQILDLMAKGLRLTPELPSAGPDRVRYIEGELVKLQRKAVDAFCQSYFYGEGVLENFLALLAETRDFLRRSEVELTPKPNSEPACLDLQTDRTREEPAGAKDSGTSHPGSGSA